MMMKMSKNFEHQVSAEHFFVSKCQIYEICEKIREYYLLEKMFGEKKHCGKTNQK